MARIATISDSEVTVLSDESFEKEPGLSVGPRLAGGREDAGASSVFAVNLKATGPQKWQARKMAAA